jgi:hypothetical protein
VSEPDCVTEKNAQCFAQLYSLEKKSRLPCGIHVIHWELNYPAYRTKHRSCSVRFASIVVMDIL